jgi:hypothetical protein
MSDPQVIKKAEVWCEYQPYIDRPPMSPKQLHAQACENDETTISSWRPIWEKNIRENHAKFGPFKDKSLGKFFGYAHQKPVICVGSGPSLKGNAHELKDRGDITVISCLHNFHFLEDLDCPADFYVSLDSGEVTIEEVSEGGKNPPEHYWNLTQGRKLLCYIGTSPKLLEKWQGEVYFFNAPVPDPDFMKIVESVEKFNTYVSNGGNVLGACMYIARAFLGASIVAYIGADFCFSYDKKFHGWDSKYDKTLGYALRSKDVFGNSVYTWASYRNFKGWFEYVAMTVPGIWYNCSEGGTLGAYNDGNIRAIVQYPLKSFIRTMNMYKEEMTDQALNPETDVKKLLF